MHLRWSLLAMTVLLGASLAWACDGDDDNGSPTGTAVPAGATDEVQLTDEDDGTTVELALNGTLVVTLPSNPSTGFAWSVKPPEPVGLALQGEPQYVPPASATPAVGAGGTQVFKFDAIETGVSQVTLIYSRSFEQEAEPEDTFAVTVRVIAP